MVPLKAERAKLEKKIKDKETELTQLERNIIALRSGKVVIRSGQSLLIAEINSSDNKNIRSQIDKIIINANRYTHNIVNPRKKEVRNLLIIRKNHVEELENIISRGGEWVINIKSVRNVLSGENFVYAFPEITENKVIVKRVIINWFIKIPSRNRAKWKDKHKLTYIVISHDEDVLEWCDNIIRL